MKRYPRSLSVPGPGSFLLCGAHGTGKSSWLAERFPDARVVDFRNPATRWEFLPRPTRLLDELAATPPGVTLVITGLPLTPDTLRVVPSLLDPRSRPRVVISVSNRTGLRSCLQRLGPLSTNPAVTPTPGPPSAELLPLTAWELGDDFSLEHALQFGTLPATVTATDPERYLLALLEGLIHDEVEASNSTRDPVAFRRFLQALPRVNGDVLTVSELAREADLHRKVVERYLTILADLFLIARVPPFRALPRPAVVGHPKLFVVDAGILRSLAAASRLSTRRRARHSALSSLIALHLRACLATRRPADRLYYWRTLASTDVDFVVAGPNGPCAITVADTSSLRNWHFNRLRCFERAYPRARLLLLHPGSRRFWGLRIPCVPIVDFLSAPWQFLPSSTTGPLDRPYNLDTQSRFIK